MCALIRQYQFVADIEILTVVLLKIQVFSVVGQVVPDV
jgi:hypothetical protein